MENHVEKKPAKIELSLSVFTDDFVSPEDLRSLIDLVSVTQESNPNFYITVNANVFK